MKDAVLTIRLPSTTRRRIEELARRERRSLSQQVEQLIELGFAARATAREPARATASEPARATARRADGADRVAEAAVPRGAPLAGCLAGGGVPTLDDFREARAELSRSLARRTRPRAQRRR
jgi:predicted transcriptional regulator